LVGVPPIVPVVSWRTSSGYLASTDPDRLDLGFIHAFLATAYWSRGVPRTTVERAIANSLPLFGLYAPSGATRRLDRCHIGAGGRLHRLVERWSPDVSGAAWSAAV